MITLILGLAEAALGEGTGAKLQKLSVKDIKYVGVPFGLDADRPILTAFPY